MSDWEEGRRATLTGGPGYRKKLLWLLMTSWFSCDGYLLHYPEGSGIPSHTDEVLGRQHWRINFVYRNCEIGGHFYGERVLIDWGRLKVFRSDAIHSVSTIIKGERRVLSIGLAF